MMMADDGRINHSKSKGIEVRNDVRGSWEGTRFNVRGLIMLPWSLSYLFGGYATTACNLSLENETTNNGGHTYTIDGAGYSWIADRYSRVEWRGGE